MPGRRLTLPDRERIAAGLAAGADYAAIARGIGRPTSTVSREVIRNGGARAYCAGAAQAATARRGRRRTPAPVPVDDDFTARFAAVLVRSGLPPMAGRVLACLVTTDAGALTAAELVPRLGVSPASISKAVGYLASLDVVTRERAGARGRERYRIDDDVWLRSWLTSARTNELWARTAREGAARFGTATPAGARLDAMARFFTALSDDMAGGPTAEVFADALTVAAALLQAGGPLPAGRLAVALEWSGSRAEAAIAMAMEHPDVIDPVARRATGSGAYEVTVRPGRLSAGQLARLTRR